jgi:hypothetical protein
MADAARLDWVKEKVCQGLSVEQELFDELLQTDGASSSILEFLDGGEHPPRD